MLEYSKQTDERREVGSMDCWCLHGAVGAASDWREVCRRLAEAGIGTRAVDLWRFLACEPMPLPAFARALQAEVSGEVFRGTGRALMGYSMGARMALHALLEPGHPWQAAVIVSAHPGLESEPEREQRRASDAQWAARCFTGNWQEFLNAWNAQPLLAGTALRTAQEATRLMARRQEIARSFVDWSLGAQQPLWQRLPEIEIPVLWIAGERDAKFRALAERAAGLLPNGRLAIAPAAGHRVPWEADQWFCREVSHFLQTGK